ncbi:MAG: type II secretion system F family protein [Candidatus Omnitrophica bacterium]|nr:type II secretion system F family protein [Candidatus Omnitrophota bacterium]
MPLYHYVAKKGPGEIIEGDLERDSRSAALQQITDMGYIPVKVEEIQRHESEEKGVDVAHLKRIPRRQINIFTRQFASLTRAQIPLLRSLGILSDQTSNPSLKAVIAAVAKEVSQGATLSGAMGNWPQVFSPFYVGITHAGEVAGTLHVVLERLSAKAEAEDRMLAKLRSALAYPIFVGIVGVLTIVALMTFVMPRLLKLFGSMGGDLPLPTVMVVTVSRWMTGWQFWVILLLGFSVLSFVWKLLGSRKKRFADRIVMQLPIVKGLVQKLDLARFSRSFGLLLENGVPILQAAEVSIPVIQNSFIREDLESLPAGLREGEKLATCLMRVPAVSDPFFINTVAVGEEGGRVGEALLEIANFCDEESDRQLQLVSALMEPVMILGVGAVVGFIVMAVLLPVFQFSTMLR